MTPEQIEKNLDRIRAIRRPDANAVGSLEPRAPYLSQPRGSLVDSATVSLRDALAGGTPFGDLTSGFIIPDAESLEGMELEINAGDFEGGIDEQEQFFSEGVQASLGDMLILSETARRFTSDEGHETIEATGNVRFNQENAEGTADRLLIRLPSSEEESTDSLPAQLFPKASEGEEGSQPARGYFEAENLHLLEPSRELDAKYIEYDLSKETGEMFHAHGRAGIFYWSAENLKILGPDEVEGEDVWFTTCDHDPPHYRVRLGSASLKEGQVVLGTNARLQLGKMNTPLFLPRWKSSGSGENRRVNYSFDSGRLAELGYFLNLARWWEVTPGVDMALRVMPTEKEGVGFGTDVEYDFMERPSSLLFRSKGEFRSMYTTEDRGYTEFYHRQELSPRTIVLAQYEQWYDRDFVKDFFYDTYRDRTGPRTFVNLTHTRPGQILTATTSVSTHDFTRETEKLPEISYHLLERRLAKRLYLTFDSFTGYYDRTRSDDNAGRSVNTARLSYDLNLGQGIGITPFVEGEGTWYSETLDLEDDSDEYRFSGVAGVTLQARLHRAYKGRWGFSGFKHIIVPSFTYSYRPDASLDSEDTPRLDALDDVPGRSRIEGKIDNIFLGRDAVLDEEWQVARVTFYHGNDFENETRKTQDYEIEIDIRPRPWWGFQAVGEHHSIDRERDLIGYVPAFETLRDFAVDARAFVEDEVIPDERRGDFSRVLAYFYYDDSKNPGGMNGRLGFAYTETDNEIFNREVLYGLGYRVNDNWGFAFEHRYDLERDELVRQTYEVRRRLHDWEAAIQLRDRESGLDIGVEFTLTAFPGARIKF
jgi:lipopolysaccharide assembly outer membrane protein LptD (OstA)